MTKLAVNFCPEADRLFHAGHVAFDLFKCPAWPSLIEEARLSTPVYVHFPLAVGWGRGTAEDNERNGPADWDALESLLLSTSTPVVNLHIAPAAVLCASGPPAAALERLLVDVRGVVARLGSTRVALENDYESVGETVNPALVPEAFCHVLRESGAGLLLDLAHAKLAARRLGMDARAYIERLPVHRLREIHVSGVQRLEPTWAGMLRDGGVDSASLARFLGRSVDGMCDHMPLTPDDWELAEWALAQVRAGVWPRPWVVSLEYGGVGPWFAPVTIQTALAHHLRKLASLVDGI